VKMRCQNSKLFLRNPKYRTIDNSSFFCDSPSQTTDSSNAAAPKYTRLSYLALGHTAVLGLMCLLLFLVHESTIPWFFRWSNIYLFGGHFSPSRSFDFSGPRHHSSAFSKSV